MSSSFNKDKVQDFICYESELIDDRKFDDWVNLFVSDGSYWVPSEHDQVDHESHVSLFYDDFATLKIRANRLAHPQLHCQSPLSRTVHVMGQTRIVEVIGGALARTRTAFMMIEDRVGAAKRLFGGHCEHGLIADGSSFKIKNKKVILTDCDQVFPALTIPF